MKLDIGCGLNTKKPLEDWTHLDIDEGPHIELVTDFGDIPLDDGAVDEIWIGDVIEHVPPWRHQEVLSEWNRVLKLNGRLSGTTPRLETVIRKYLNQEIDFDWLLQNLYGDRNGYPNQHYTLFTEHTLDILLRQYGFDNVDYSGSPGPKEQPWWIVFDTKKVRDL
jgi:predicted SAM-dependent methyltransferase